MFRSLVLLSGSLLLLLQVAGAAQDAPPAPNSLTKAQKQAGWKLLFDGKSTDGWRRYRSEKFPEKGWIIEEGTLKVCHGGGGGDIITRETFGDYELYLEWKVSERANSGIIYMIGEDENAPWKTGPEYQLFDDKGHGVDATNTHSSGAMYDLYAPPAHKPVKAAGEWNQTRIVIRDGVVEHWLNGVQLVECDLNSDDWKTRREKSKFNPYAKFAKVEKGHIGLQDHGHDVWFRNIRIRDLTREAGHKEVPLFNGKDLTGWSYHLNEEGKMEDTWHVEEGVLVCKGKPAGYIYTDKEYTNFILKLQWRFNPVTKQAGNSGVLLRMTGPHKVWPKSVEAQLHSTNAGDFWNIGEFDMKTDTSRTRGRNTKKTHLNEHPVGEWNDYEITVNKGDVILVVNGEVLNTAWEVAEIPGKIGLQSEGAEIQFRNIRLIPLDT